MREPLGAGEGGRGHEEDRDNRVEAGGQRKWRCAGQRLEEAEARLHREKEHQG